jgi:hypothetical protein
MAALDSRREDGTVGRSVSLEAEPGGQPAEEDTMRWNLKYSIKSYVSGSM